GLNFPMVPYMISADIVSRADASFQNIWMLQDCGETIYEFASDEQKNEYLPRVAKGETMSMDLTEPDAGSDLQAVMLKASHNEKEGQWYLNGVKRFITNGDADIHLVLARSEEGTKDARGLSMYVY
ncbi:MAG TPA: acyl-CoA dehydrogenase, partial [Porphyromonadaceae bacterium]|nr:acyl-CoA dehydrogenase [Porphyromonadaceae bacterium]